MTWEKPWGWPIWYSLKEVQKELEEKRKRLNDKKSIFSLRWDVKTNVNSLIKQKK